MHSHLPTYYRRLINVLHTKRHKSRICMNDSVKNKHHILYDLKNIYFEFQSRITWATGLGVTLPLLRRNSRKGINVMRSLIHKKHCVPQMLLFHAGSCFSVYPTLWRNIPKDAQALWFNVTIITCVRHTCPCLPSLDGWACLDKSPTLRFHYFYRVLKRPLEHLQTLNLQQRLLGK